MKPNIKAQSSRTSVIHLLLLTLFFSLSGISAQPAAGQLNPLQIALLKWSPNLTATFRVGSHPHGIAFDGTNVWISNVQGNTVTEQSVVAGSSVAVVSFVALNLLAQRFGALKASGALDYYGALPVRPAAVVSGSTKNVSAVPASSAAESLRPSAARTAGSRSSR